MSARVAILAGTGIYGLPGLIEEPQMVSTPYGQVPVYRCGLPDLVFLPRHGLKHDQPPHRINYLANFWALHELGVEAVVAAYAVGSLHTGVPAGGLSLLSDFLDRTQGRPNTFYNGGDQGVGHADMSQPYCGLLGQALLDAAARRGLPLHPAATYACTEGPRFESPAEVRMLASWGGDVVGMTGCPEVSLARELGIHFAGVALSINLGVGLEDQLRVLHALDLQRQGLMEISLEVLQAYGAGKLSRSCSCLHAVEIVSPPRRPIPRATRSAAE